MKTLTLISILLITFSSICQTPSEREIKMFDEINNLRTNPKSYIPKVESFIRICEKKIQMISDGKLKTTTDFNEDILAARELISVLDTLKELKPLEFNLNMYIVSKSHGDYLKKYNIESHYGLNKELAPKRMCGINIKDVTENIIGDNGTIAPTIITLLVDARIEGRGHRNNILSSSSKFISIYTNGDTWIQNFAR